VEADRTVEAADGPIGGYHRSLENAESKLRVFHSYHKANARPMKGTVANRGPALRPFRPAAANIRTIFMQPDNTSAMTELPASARRRLAFSAAIGVTVLPEARRRTACRQDSAGLL